MDYSGFIIPILAIIDGLLFGLAIKKGIVSFILLLVAFVISGYIGFTNSFKMPVSDIFSRIVSFVENNAHGLATLVPIGSTGAVSLLVVLFVIGLGIGIWKG